MKHYVSENPVKESVKSLVESLNNKGIIEKDNYYVSTIVVKDKNEDINSVVITVKKGVE